MASVVTPLDQLKLLWCTVLLLEQSSYRRLEAVRHGNQPLFLGPGCLVREEDCVLQRQAATAPEPGTYECLILLYHRTKRATCQTALLQPSLCCKQQ